jgi:hypothetical protein
MNSKELTRYAPLLAFILSGLTAPGKWSGHPAALKDSRHARYLVQSMFPDTASKVHTARAEAEPGDKAKINFPGNCYRARVRGASVRHVSDTLRAFGLGVDAHFGKLRNQRRRDHQLRGQSLIQDPGPFADWLVRQRPPAIELARNRGATRKITVRRYINPLYRGANW